MRPIKREYRLWLVSLRLPFRRPLRAGDEDDKRIGTPRTPSPRGEGWDEANKKASNSFVIDVRNKALAK